MGIWSVEAILLAPTLVPFSRAARHHLLTGELVLFDLFKKNSSNDRYLERVASILHSTLAPMLSLPQAYGLAAECLSDLKGMISKGVFLDGPNPRESVMAYFSLCTMVHEARSSDDGETVFKIAIFARVQGDKLKDQRTFTPLEKGICQFGASVLAEGTSAHSAEDVSKVKTGAVSIILELLQEQGASVSHDDIKQLVENVSALVVEREIVKVGDKVLAISSLTNVTGYSIDQGDLAMANVYFRCVMAAMDKFVKGQQRHLNEHQMGALRTIMRSYKKVVQELQAANAAS